MLGKHSGRAALADRAKRMGYTLTAEQLQTVFEQFKALADKKKQIYDADIAALIEQEIRTGAGTVVAGVLPSDFRDGQGADRGVAPASRRAKKRAAEMAGGDGPIDAVFLAIESMTGVSVSCRDFSVHSVTVGKDAQGEVLVEVEHEGRIFRGRGVSTDSVEASAKAFLAAINRIAAAVR